MQQIVQQDQHQQYKLRVYFLHFEDLDETRKHQKILHLQKH